MSGGRVLVSLPLLSSAYDVARSLVDVVLGRELLEVWATGRAAGRVARELRAAEHGRAEVLTDGATLVHREDVRKLACLAQLLADALGHDRDPGEVLVDELLGSLAYALALLERGGVASKSSEPRDFLGTGSRKTRQPCARLSPPGSLLSPVTHGRRSREDWP